MTASIQSHNSTEEFVLISHYGTATIFQLVRRRMEYVCEHVYMSDEKELCVVIELPFNSTVQFRDWFNRLF